jgi:hypothetical protein
LGRSERGRSEKRSGVDKGGSRPAAGKIEKIEKLKKLKTSARQGEFILDKIRHAPNPTGAMDVNSGVFKGSEGMRNKYKCGAAGTKELNILPTKCKAFLFDIHGLFKS